MSTTIVTCPACNALVLGDTAECPQCDHVIDAARLTTGEGPDLEKTHEEFPCRHCGEPCRTGLVRCFNCGNFLREDIARHYQRMQASERRVIYSEVDEEETETNAPVEASDDDFVLSGTAVFPDTPMPQAQPGWDQQSQWQQQQQQQQGWDQQQAAYYQQQQQWAQQQAYAQQQGYPQQHADPNQQQWADPSQQQQQYADPNPQQWQQPQAPAQPEAETYEVAQPTPPPAETQTPAATEPPAPAETETPGEAPAAEKPAEQPASEPQAPAKAHSEETGGDALLNIAIQEQREAKHRRRRTPKYEDGFFVNCSMYECNTIIEVRERHRGKVGRCPKCKSAYVVPERAAETPQHSASEGEHAPVEQPAAETAQAVATGAAAAGGDAGAMAAAAAVNVPQADIGEFKYWLDDLEIAPVDPDKLKLKEGCLAGSRVKVDAGFSQNGMLLVTHVKPVQNLFGGTVQDDKKIAKNRLTAQEHLKGGGNRTETPAFRVDFYDNDSVRSALDVAFPPHAGGPTIFENTAVFGSNIVAVRFPDQPADPKKKNAKPQPQYAALPLTMFRSVSAIVRELYGVALSTEGIPLSDDFNEKTCHYSERAMPVLQSAGWYEADPEIDVELLGYQCENCGLVVSEDSRKKEGMGGKGAKGLAKIACPKCEEAFGENPLYTLAGMAPEEEAMS